MSNKEELYFQKSSTEFATSSLKEAGLLFADTITLPNSKEFDSSNNLEKDEWFYIDLSDDQGERLSSFLKEAIDGSRNDISKEDYTSVKSVCQRKAESIVFQRIYPRQQMSNISFLSFETKLLSIKDITGMTIQKGHTDAILNFKEKRLYFKNFATIKPLFKGIDNYYSIATLEEFKNFAISFPIAVEDEDNIFSKIGDRNKKNIAFLMDNSKSAEDIKAVDFKDWENYAKKYEVEIKTDANKKAFVLESNEDLTNILKVLLEKYYESEVTKTKKEAR